MESDDSNLCLVDGPDWNTHLENPKRNCLLQFTPDVERQYVVYMARTFRQVRYYAAVAWWAGYSLLLLILVVTNMEPVGLHYRITVPHALFATALPGVAVLIPLPVVIALFACRSKSQGAIDSVAGFFLPNETCPEFRCRLLSAYVLEVAQVFTLLCTAFGSAGGDVVAAGVIGFSGTIAYVLSMLLSPPRLRHAAYALPIMMVIQGVASMLVRLFAGRFEKPIFESRPMSDAVVEHVARILFVVAAVGVMIIQEILERDRFTALVAVHCARRSLADHQRGVDELTAAAVPPQALARIRAAEDPDDVFEPDVSSSAAVCVVRAVDLSVWSHRLLPGAYVWALHQLLVSIDKAAESHEVARTSAVFDTVTAIAGLGSQGELGNPLHNPSAESKAVLRSLIFRQRIHAFASEVVCFQVDPSGSDSSVASDSAEYPTDQLRPVADSNFRSEGVPPGSSPSNLPLPPVKVNPPSFSLTVASAFCVGPAAGANVSCGSSVRYVVTGPAVDACHAAVQFATGGQVVEVECACVEREVASHTMSVKDRMEAKRVPLADSWEQSTNQTFDGHATAQPDTSLDLHEEPSARGRARGQYADQAGRRLAVRRVLGRFMDLEVEAAAHQYLLYEDVTPVTATTVAAAVGVLVLFALESVAVQKFLWNHTFVAGTAVIVFCLSRIFFWRIYKLARQRIQAADSGGSCSCVASQVIVAVGSVRPIIIVLVDHFVAVVIVCGATSLKVDLFRAVDPWIVFCIVPQFFCTSHLWLATAALITIQHVCVTHRNPRHLMIIAIETMAIFLSQYLYHREARLRYAALQLADGTRQIADSRAKLHVALVEALLPPHAAGDVIRAILDGSRDPLKPVALRPRTQAVVFAARVGEQLKGAHGVQYARSSTVSSTSLGGWPTASESRAVASSTAGRPRAPSNAVLAKEAIENAPLHALRFSSQFFSLISLMMNEEHGLLELFETTGDSCLLAGPFSSELECEEALHHATVAALRIAFRTAHHIQTLHSDGKLGYTKRCPALQVSLSVGSLQSALLGTSLVSCRLLGPGVREACGILGSMPIDSGTFFLAAPGFRRSLRAALTETTKRVTSSRANCSVNIEQSAGSTVKLSRLPSFSVALNSWCNPVISSRLATADDVGPEGDAVFLPPNRFRVRGVGVVTVSAVRQEAVRRFINDVQVAAAQGGEASGIQQTLFDLIDEI